MRDLVGEGIVMCQAKVVLARPNSTFGTGEADSRGRDCSVECIVCRVVRSY